MSDDIKFRDTAAISLFQALLSQKEVWNGTQIVSLIKCAHLANYDSVQGKSINKEIKEAADLSYQLADYLREARLKVFE